MNIEVPITRKNSAILARLMGWETTADDWVIWRREGVTYHVDLYDGASMAIAWRVLNWAFRGEESPILQSFYDDGKWWYWHEFFKMPPAEAQAAWLDKVLELTIAAGEGDSRLSMAFDEK